MTKGEQLAKKRKYFKSEKRRLSPKEKGIVIQKGKERAEAIRLGKNEQTT